MTKNKAAAFIRNNKSIFALTGILMLSVFLFFSCSAGKSVSVKIYAGTKALADETVSLGNGVSTAYDAFEKAAEKAGIVLVEEGGMVTKIGDYMGTETEGWCFYINGKVADVGAKEYVLKDKDNIAFSFVKWADVFPTVNE